MSIIYRKPDELIFIQSRAEADEATIAEYAAMMADGIEFDPVQAIEVDGIGPYYVWDGYHRGEAARRADTLLAVAVTPGTKEEAEWLALSANQKHGLKRSNADKQKVVREALLHPSGAKLSDSAIARHCGVSQPMVGKVRKELEASYKLYKIETRTVTRGGQTYEVNTAPIGNTQIDYVEVWELERSIRTWAAGQAGSPSGQIELLEALTSGSTQPDRDTMQSLVAGDILPGPRRKRDVIQACHNTLEQFRQEQHAGDNHTRAGGRQATPFDYAAPASGPEPPDVIICPRCDEAIFLRQDTRPDGSIVCDACKKKFPSYEALVAQVEKPKVYARVECPGCGQQKVFIFAERNYVCCDGCGREWTAIDAFHAERRGWKPYEPFPCHNCGEEESITRTGEGPMKAGLKCSACGEIWRSLADYRQEYEHFERRRFAESEDGQSETQSDTSSTCPKCHGPLEERGLGAFHCRSCDGWWWADTLAPAGEPNGAGGPDPVLLRRLEITRRFTELVDRFPADKLDALETVVNDLFEFVEKEGAGEQSAVY